MKNTYLQKELSRGYRRLTFRKLLIIPFVLEISLVVGLVYYWSFRSGQQTIEHLVFDLSAQVNKQIDQHLDSYLSNIRKLNELNVATINASIIDPSDRDRLVRFFRKQVELYDVGYILFSTVSGRHLDVGKAPDRSGLVTGQIDPQRYGNTRYHVYALDQHGESSHLLDSTDYAVQTEGWYKDVMEEKRSLWSEIYPWEQPSIGRLAIAVSSPVYDREKNLLGVVAIEQRLCEISDFLRELKVSPSVKVFVMERDGMLVASNAAPPFQQTNDFERLRASDSPDLAIRAIAQYLTEHFKQLERIQISHQLTVDIEGQQQFIHVTPWQDELGLDWLIIVAIPKSDFTNQINQNTRYTILLSTGALLVAIGIGICIVQMITFSVKRLTDFAKKITAGNLSQSVNVKGIYELELLSQAYNQMVERLRRSFADLESANHKLEQRVEERTAELQALNHELHHLSKIDSLTQVANRRYFDEYLVQEWNRLKREQQPLSLILCDLDYFKDYNDFYGHQGGDRCLQAVAKGLQEVVKRPADLVARYGGEEFAVVLPTTDIEGAVVVARAIQQMIWRLKIPHARSKVRELITMSLGIASWVPQATSSPEHLLAAADAALYTAKREGRDRFKLAKRNC